MIVIPCFITPTTNYCCHSWMQRKHAEIQPLHCTIIFFCLRLPHHDVIKLLNRFSLYFPKSVKSIGNQFFFIAIAILLPKQCLSSEHSLKTRTPSAFPAIKGRRFNINNYIKENRSQWTPLLPHALVADKLTWISIRRSNVR